MKEKILKILDSVPRPIKWMFTRIGRVMVLGVLAASLFATSQIDSISVDANHALYYTSIVLAVYPLLAGLWYILNGLVLNPFIILVGEDNKSKTLQSIAKFIRKWQLKIH